MQVVPDGCEFSSFAVVLQPRDSPHQFQSFKRPATPSARLLSLKRAWALAKAKACRPYAVRAKSLLIVQSFRFPATRRQHHLISCDCCHFDFSILCPACPLCRHSTFSGPLSGRIRQPAIGNRQPSIIHSMIRDSVVPCPYDSHSRVRSQRNAPLYISTLFQLVNSTGFSRACSRTCTNGTVKGKLVSCKEMLSSTVGV